MLLLTTTTDKIQVTSGTAADIDVHASWVDNASGTLTYGRTNTAITTATTSDVVAAPGSSTTRNIKTLHIRNKDTADTTDITVIYDQNGTDYELWKATLSPGEHLSYVEGIGFFEAAASVSAFTPTISTADQTIGASTTVYLTSSGLNLNGRSLRAGTMFMWDVILQKTNASTASMTFDLRVGTAGTTGDTSRGSIATGTQSAVTDQGYMKVMATIQSISATGTLRFGAEIVHNLAATGLGPTNAITAQSTSGTFDTTATNLIFGLSLTTGASHSITISQILGRVFNISGASVGP